MNLRALGLTLLAGVAVLLTLSSAASALDIADGEPPSGTVGVPYSYTFNLSPGSGTRATWDISAGALPPGLSLSGSDRSATVSGTPTQAGSFRFYLRATDIPGPWVCCTEALYTINIAEGLSIVTGSLPTGSVGAAYGFQLGTSGGTASSWSVTAGSLPPGLSLGNNGAITGTPTQAALSTFTVKATDGSRIATKDFTLAIAEPVVVTPPAETTIKLGRSFVVTFAATGGVGPYVWTASTLPDGVNVDAASGKVGGRPTEAGDIQLAITATDKLGTAQTGTAVVHVVEKVSIGTSTLPKARNGKPYRALLEATGGATPYTLRLIGALPRGLSFDADQGIVQGVPKLKPRKPRIKVKVVHTAKGKTRRIRIVKRLKPLAHTYTLYFVVRDDVGQRASQKLRLTVTP
jgi:large repetitive protein